MNGLLASLVALGILTAAPAAPAATAGDGGDGARPAQASIKGDWQPLLEESSANAWRGWKAEDFPAGWHVAHGVLSKTGAVDDLVSREQFANFELELQWKIGKAGNSGVFYRGTREYDHIYGSAPEYQLLDDANTVDGRSRLTAAASAYAIYPALAGVVRPFGHWNSTRIVVDGAHVEQWLNGQKVVEYELWSPDWKARVAASKFAAYPGYGLAKRGRLGIQGDHPGTLALRHMRIRPLP